MSIASQHERTGRVVGGFLRALIWYVILFHSHASADDPLQLRAMSLLRERCYPCHSAAARLTEGGLDLSDAASALAGGASGPAIVPGKSDVSRLLQRISSREDGERMPPDGALLTEEEIALVRGWIDAGAEWPQGMDAIDPRMAMATSHWAFQPLQRPKNPIVSQPHWTRTPIDSFILQSLERHHLTPTRRADPRILIRRLSFDLIGLPPDPSDVERFCAAFAAQPDAALEQLVDRLLLSPHYGERWGRHWLDVARYADSDGQESDRDRLLAYPYRDFVIRAFNADLPYDEFVRWQLAGDEIAPADPQAIAATGFLIAGPFAALPDRLMEDERLRNRFNELDDMLSTIGTGFLGMTLGCARCHDHKYDPIPAEDYYRLLATLQSGERAEIPLGNDGAKVLAYRELDAIPEPAWLFRRGNYYDREIPVQIGFLSALTREKQASEYWQESQQNGSHPQSTHQRHAVANWITDVEQGAGALLARVFVNRIWHHHFGAGIVRTTGDFGSRAESPTHPELLEWLAWDLVQHGWQVKRLQRMIVLSEVYLQANLHPDAGHDPDHRLLSRMPLRRLEGEGLRDAMLSVSGTLNREAFGPAVKIPIPAEAIVARNLKDAYPDQIADSPAVRRRAVYLFHKRVVPDPLQQAFDKPDAQQSCSRRDHTTVAPQALALLNDPFVRTVAGDFAERLARETAATPEMIERAFRLALARPPSEMELSTAVRFIEDQHAARRQRQPNAADDELFTQAVADFCQVLFGLNEFIYIE